MVTRHARRLTAGLVLAFGLALPVIAVAGGSLAAQETAAVGRTQLHRNGARGVPYLPLAVAGDASSTATLTMQVAQRIELDGDALNNVRGNLYPIDVDADGRYEFLHFNGFRFMRVYAASGRKLWQVQNPSGRLHRDTIHRDTLAVLDVDDDGRQEIVHCWTDAGARKKRLLVRRGSDGLVLRSIDVEGHAREECQIGAFRVAGRAQPILLVSHQYRGAASCPRRANYVDIWARTVAFDLQLGKLWDRNSCFAGHYLYPVDADADGAAEAIFIGRHLYAPDGTLRCTIPGFGQDHADAVGVADLMPASPGLEAVAVGSSGTRAVRVRDCAPLWSVSTRMIRNPQSLAVAQLEVGNPTPQIMISERGSEPGYRTFILTGSGAIRQTFRSGAMRETIPMQNADLDGQRGTDELLGSFATAFDGAGKMRLDRSWYWGLKGGLVREVPGQYPKSYDRWAPFPLLVDLDRDGREEIVTWSQSLIVVGKAG
jgi:hypothetical protein